MSRAPRFSPLVGISAFWSAGTVGTATAAAASKVCPQVTGTKSVAPYAPHPSGTSYDLTVSGTMTCSKAAGYLKKVVARHVHTGQSFAGGFNARDYFT